MTFAHRMIGAMAAEDTVLQQLTDAGFRAFRFGQALLPDEFRSALKDYVDDEGKPSLVRWFPDLIAYRRHAFVSSPKVVLFDVKSDSGRTQNYAIETKALETCEAFQADFRTPCWFIYAGLAVLTPEAVRANCWAGPEPVFGSGTPYVLVRKDHAVQLDALLT